MVLAENEEIKMKILFCFDSCDPEPMVIDFQHPASKYHQGVLLRTQGEIMDGREFARDVKVFGASIIVDTAETAKSVQNKLATDATGVTAAIKIVGNDYYAFAGYPTTAQSNPK